MKPVIAGITAVVVLIGLYFLIRPKSRIHRTKIAECEKNIKLYHLSSQLSLHWRLFFL